MSTRARLRGISPDRCEAETDEHLARLLGEMELFVRIRVPKLEAMLEDGRYKTQFETFESSGLLEGDPRSPQNRRRSRTEHWVFGISPGADPTERPIYGYLHSDPDGHREGRVDQLAQYGTVALRVTPAVRLRSTFTGGDTIDQTDGGYEPEVCPAPVNHPRWTAISYYLGDILRFPRAVDVFRRLESNLDDPVGYLEAQIFGGLSLADLSEVVLLEPPGDRPKQLLDQVGLRWRVV